MATATRTTVVGVFAHRAGAEQAIADLRRAGFADSHIGMVARNEDGKVERSGAAETMAEEGAVAGAVAGAGVGAAVGLAVLAGMVPAIGPAIVAGTLGTILTNAVGGAALAGLTGALIGFGIPEDDATYYEDQVKAGRFLVTVDAGDRSPAEVWSIMHRHGAYNRMTGVK